MKEGQEVREEKEGEAHAKAAVKLWQGCWCPSQGGAMAGDGVEGRRANTATCPARARVRRGRAVREADDGGGGERGNGGAIGEGRRGQGGIGGWQKWMTCEAAEERKKTRSAILKGSQKKKKTF